MVINFFLTFWMANANSNSRIILTNKFIGKDYSRVRIGIGHPKDKKKVNNHVLEDFKEDEEDQIKEIADNIVKLIPTLLEKKIDLFSSKVNSGLNGI